MEWYLNHQLFDYVALRSMKSIGTANLYITVWKEFTVFCHTSHGALIYTELLNALLSTSTAQLDHAWYGCLRT